MDRGSSAEPLSWLIVPAAGILIASALSLSLQPYTGVTLRGDEVMSVVPGSPGAAAGLAGGDRLAGRSPAMNALRGPLVEARPGVALRLTRERAGRRLPVWLVPSVQPVGERRMMAALLAVASGFVLLGGWVWSERRDRLTRPFQLLCLAFAALLAPPPRLPWAAAGVAHELFYTAATLALPSLCVHFFALFPEPRAPGGRLTSGVNAAYGVAALLYAGWVAALAVALAGHPLPGPTLGLFQGAAAVWFAAGLLLAVALFARSYLRADSVDARRRLRVALAGTALGLGPLATLTVLHNLLPGFAVPGERLAVVLTLLVPLSFTWATVIHRIFDFRVALRAATVAIVLALAGGALYFAGELANALQPDAGADFGGVALALVSLAASVAGPMRPGMRALAGGLVPLRDVRPLAEAFADELAGRDPSVEELLSRACAALASALKLDRCAALDLEDGPELRAWAGGSAPPFGLASLRLGSGFTLALAGRVGALRVGELPLGATDREALEAAGIQWVLPVGLDSPVAALLLGRRLAGAWLDRREVESLERCAQHLGVALENVALRRAARSHGALDRELQEAGAIQAHLLPRRAPVFPTLDCAAATLSSEAVGGDYYDFVQHEDRVFTLVVGDAAGHGVPAALLLAGVQARFRAEAAHDLDPGRLLTALNLELSHHDQPARFVGLLCARVDVQRGRIHFANAGLMPPFVRRRSGAWEEVTTGGLLLGVRPDAVYPDSRVELLAGDVALIYTDGLTEARRGEELFGVERVQQVLDRAAHRRAADILQDLLAGVRSFADRPLDDLTVVVLKQLADPPRVPAPRERNRTSSLARVTPIPRLETTDAVSPARAANPRAADPKG